MICLKNVYQKVFFVLNGGLTVAVNLENYLYWSKQDNLVEEIVYREMYSRFGYIFHTLQMVEYNLANILAIEEFEKETKAIFEEKDINEIKDKINKKYEELSKYTFGKLKSIVKDSKYLKEIDLNCLEEIIKYRNYLAHNCFKEKLLENQLISVEDVDIFVNELNDFEEKIVSFNEILLEIFEKNKKKSVLLKCKKI